MRLFTAISFSLLILISTIGVSVNKHYCQSTDQYIYTFFGGSEPCSCVEVAENTSCHYEKSCSSEEGIELKKGCCDDEVLYVQLDTDFLNEVADVSPDVNWDFITVIFHTVLGDQITINDSPDIVGLNFYTPPPIADCDLCITFQSFLI